MNCRASPVAYGVVLVIIATFMFNALHFLRFHAKRTYSYHPRLLVVLASVMALNLFVGAYFFQLLAATQDASLQRQSLLKGRIPAKATSSREVQAVLQPFDGAQLLETLTAVGDSTNLSLGPVVFSLDDSGRIPYLRYRAAFTVSGSYLVIRRFIDQFHSSLSDVSLDSMNCTRKDIRDTMLECDLSFSAFYRKDGNG